MKGTIRKRFEASGLARALELGSYLVGLGISLSSVKMVRLAIKFVLVCCLVVGQIVGHTDCDAEVQITLPKDGASVLQIFEVHARVVLNKQPLIVGADTQLCITVGTQFIGCSNTSQISISNMPLG